MMADQSIGFLIALVAAIIVVLVLIVVIRKDISSKVYARVLDIENDSQFLSQIQLKKSKIDAAIQLKLDEKISIRKQYLIEDAIRRSATVTKGKIIEHFAPFMLEGVLNPDEMVFIGSPIDLISFTNIDMENDISLDFLEIKTGNSSLNKKQKLIKDAVFNKRVYYKTVFLNY